MNNPAPECLITGCTLIDIEQGKQVHGDLHRLCDAYIFNACLNSKGEANWEYIGVACNSRAVFAEQYFERRGVLVFAVCLACFNQAAEDYLYRG